MLDRTDIQRITAAMVGALILSTACIASGASPAAASAPTTARPCGCNVVFLAK